MTAFSGIYANRSVLITGHTGFKGSWLACWLASLGARLSGIALPPARAPSHWDMLGRSLDLRHHEQDIRAAEKVAALLRAEAPEIVFHLAAQPLVRRSYRDPLETFSTNVMGTANVLEACRQTPSVRAIVVVTTDKCYENLEQEKGYREDDRLGGHDPYSASKAAAEIVAASFRKSYFSDENAPLLATARAGNVIGGGDWSEDRLVPDLARAIAAGGPLVIRSPKATRPWQHVLEPLSGYLLLGQRLLQGDREAATAFNFGPDDSGNQTVETVLRLMRESWPAVDWQVDAAPQPHEAKLLHLDSAKARETLQWRPVWSLAQGIGATVEWYRRRHEAQEVVTGRQIDDYMRDAKSAGLGWAAA